MVSFTKFAVILTSFSASVLAVNDWSKPCFSGVCEYSLPATSGASGSLKIWGSDNAITDITKAAGWEIFECDSGKTDQDIRLVCNTDEESSGCAHLYKNIGAEGKIVRLPESCGKNAFARISKAWVPENQEIPGHVAKRLYRRDGAPPQVKALRLDTKFDAVDVSKAGTVNIAIIGSNAPGVEPGISEDLAPTKKLTSRIVHGGSRPIERRLFGFIKKAAKKVASAAKSVVKGVGKVLGKVGDVFEDVVDAVKDLNEVGFNKTKALSPINVDKKVTLLDESLDCENLKASAKITADAKADALIVVGIVASGTIIPPKLDEFEASATVTADVDGKITFNANVRGNVKSKDIKLFEAGIPGLDFPGIFSIGPTFTVVANAQASLELTVDLEVALKYKLNQARLTFPANDGSNKLFNFEDTPLLLSATPNVKGTGRLEAHLIPSLNLGISALGGVAKAEIFINLDASAAAVLTVEAGGSLQTEIGRREPELLALPAPIEETIDETADEDAEEYDLEARRRRGGRGRGRPSRGRGGRKIGGGRIIKGGRRIGGKVVAGGAPAAPAAPAAADASASSAADVSAPSATNATVPVTSSTAPAPTRVAAPGTKVAAVDLASVNPSASAAVDSDVASSTALAPATPSAPAKGSKGNVSNTLQFGGCFGVDLGLAINAGADASFFGLFDGKTQKTLLKKNFKLFEKCFGSKSKRSAFEFSRLTRAAIEARQFGFNCPKADTPAPVSVINENVSPAAA